MFRQLVVRIIVLLTSVAICGLISIGLDTARTHTDNTWIGILIFGMEIILIIAAIACVSQMPTEVLWYREDRAWHKTADRKLNAALTDTPTEAY